MSGQAVDVVFRGVRGSVPTPEASNRRFGGHTACLEMIPAPDHRLLVDCGTGLAAVDLDRNPGSALRRFDVLLSHYHADHIFGLPFFEPLYDAAARFTFYGPAWRGRGVRQLLESALRPPWFPIPLADTPAEKRYVDLPDGSLELAGIRVTHVPLRHPQGAVAYRFDRGGRSMVYATDHEAGEEKSDQRLRSLADETDVFIHDAQYTPDEVERYSGWGHSTWRQAAENARRAGARRLVLFHHDPARSDDDLDAIVDEATREFDPVEAAKEGTTLRL